eukprot:7165389-Karenia_brevis.AAC.1
MRPNMRRGICTWGLAAPHEGRRDSWFAGAPRLTYCQACEMVVAAAREPACDSSMEDPKTPTMGT